MKKIYIAGAGGMLGEAFHAVFSPEYAVRCTDKNVNESWLSLLDFRDRAAYLADVERFAPDYLFHLGAHTDLEYCERNVDDAYMTNTLSVENACYIANRLGIPLLYVSTAGIFDGSKQSFDDWDLPNPLGHYARSKWAGEQLVIRNVQDHLVCRAGWMMGGGPRKDKKFVQKIMRQIKSGATELNVVNDRLGTPTYTFDFAANVKALLQGECWGLYNMVCEGETSRLEVARKLVALLGLENRLRINEVPSEFFSKEFFAPRPESERLVNRKLKLRGMNLMRDWRVSLKEYLDVSYKGYL